MSKLKECFITSPSHWRSKRFRNVEQNRIVKPARRRQHRMWSALGSDAEEAKRFRFNLLLKESFTAESNIKVKWTSVQLFINTVNLKQRSVYRSVFKAVCWLSKRLVYRITDILKDRLVVAILNSYLEMDRITGFQLGSTWTMVMYVLQSVLIYAVLNLFCHPYLNTFKFSNKTSILVQLG